MRGAKGFHDDDSRPGVALSRERASPVRRHTAETLLRIISEAREWVLREKTLLRDRVSLLRRPLDAPGESSDDRPSTPPTAAPPPPPPPPPPSPPQSTFCRSAAAATAAAARLSWRTKQRSYPRRRSATKSSSSRRIARAGTVSGALATKASVALRSTSIVVWLAASLGPARMSRRGSAARYGPPHRWYMSSASISADHASLAAARRRSCQNRRTARTRSRAAAGPSHARRRRHGSLASSISSAVVEVWAARKERWPGMACGCGSVLTCASGPSVSRTLRCCARLRTMAASRRSILGCTASASRLSAPTSSGKRRSSSWNGRRCSSRHSHTSVATRSCACGTPSTNDSAPKWSPCSRTSSGSASSPPSYAASSSSLRCLRTPKPPEERRRVLREADFDDENSFSDFEERSRTRPDEISRSARSPSERLRYAAGSSFHRPRPDLGLLVPTLSVERTVGVSPERIDGAIGFLTLHADGDVGSTPKPSVASPPLSRQLLSPIEARASPLSVREAREKRPPPRRRRGSPRFSGAVSVSVRLRPGSCCAKNLPSE